VRASYFDETREQVDGPLKTLHYRKIALIYPDDAFGEAVLQGVETMARRRWKRLHMCGSQTIRLPQSRK
jgi:hypothetical protein